MTKMRLGTLKRLIREAVSEGYIELTYGYDDSIIVHLPGGKTILLDPPDFDETDEDPAVAFPFWLEKIANKYKINLIEDMEACDDMSNPVKMSLDDWKAHVGVFIDKYQK